MACTYNNEMPTSSYIILLLFFFFWSWYVFVFLISYVFYSWFYPISFQLLPQESFLQLNKIILKESFPEYAAYIYLSFFRSIPCMWLESMLSIIIFSNVLHLAVSVVKNAVHLSYVMSALALFFVFIPCIASGFWWLAYKKCIFVFFK